MKKLLCVLLLLCISINFAACGEDAPVVVSPAPQAGDPSTGNGAGGISAVLSPEDADCAVVIGDHKLSSAGFCYYFYDTVNNFFYSFGDNYEATDDILDPAKPLNEQMYRAEDDITWADYFVELAFQDAKRDLVLYGLAQKDGWTLPEAEESELDSAIKNLDSNAALYGFSGTDSYLRAYYGPDSNTANYRAYLQLQAIADGYYDWHLQSLHYDDATLRAYEKDKYDDYTSFSYHSVYLSFTYFTDLPKETEGTAEISAVTDEADARILLKTAAEELATAKTAAELEEKIHALTVKDGVSLHPTHTKNRLGTELAAANQVLTDWVTAPERKEGDVAALPVTGTNGQLNGYHIALFSGKNENKETMGNVRHLLVAFDSETITDEVRAAAKEKAEGYLNTWKTGAATEEYFIELVKAHSQDTYLEDGGLYENIHPGSNYVEPFESWATDPARVPGETGIIETDYGFHVMYYVGDSALTYRDYVITGELANTEQQVWYEDAMAAVSTEVRDTSGLPLDLILSPE